MPMTFSPRIPLIFLLPVLAWTLGACSTGRQGTAAGLAEDYPSLDVLHREKGTATFYHNKFHGRRTASGEAYSKHAFTAAHRTFPFGTWVRVINERNGRSVVVRVNDRGPWTRKRVIDLSRAAAEEIGMVKSGLAAVSLEVVGWGKRTP